ncbi:DUF2026 family protein [Thioalkalicoccus limnaeus]|uniref:DUF2026 family protein n=1 Tax=Thioalkalicoccus limnaeus TaxID=120681 RepID=A0ABV4BI83_9GAMM
MSGSRPLITLRDYERIFRVIHALLKNENATLTKSCLYFGFIGAAILRERLATPADAAVGLGMYKLDDSGNIMTFGKRLADGRIESCADGFHCWVRANGWFVDFSAPLFQEMYAEQGVRLETPRKMYQRNIDSIATDPSELRNPGDALLIENPVLTEYYRRHRAQHPMNEDLENLAVNWFRKTPKRINTSIRVGNQKGEVVAVTLSKYRVSGWW